MDRHSEFSIHNSALCLIARRQQLPTQPCTFFWISDGLALDGVIRSDNRGSESLFPLYLIDEAGHDAANFASQFVEYITDRIDLSWLPAGSGDLKQTFGPEELLAFIYAVFHSPTYRETYAESLRIDFPRVLAPSSARIFARLSRLGKELVDLHLLRTSVLSTQYSVLSKRRRTDDSSTPPALDEHHQSAAIENFRAGGYLALRKWLQPRQRTAADPEYAQIAAAIARTIEIMAEIDQVVEQSGGWARAFGNQANT